MKDSTANYRAYSLQIIVTHVVCAVYGCSLLKFKQDTYGTVVLSTSS